MLLRYNFVDIYTKNLPIRFMKHFHAVHWEKLYYDYWTVNICMYYIVERTYIK